MKPADRDIPRERATDELIFAYRFTMSFLQQLAGLSSREKYFGTNGGVGWSVGNGGWGAVGAAPLLHAAAC